MTEPFLPYAKQSINTADMKAVSAALSSDIITRGPKVEAFERAMAEYCQADYAVAFNSGTSALMATYFAARISVHDRVISTPNSFIATIGAAIQLGVMPHFIDIDRATGSLDINKLQTKLDFYSTRGRVVVLPVHFAGMAVDMMALRSLLDAHPNAIIIEDAAHALGSFYPNGQRVGCCAHSDMTIFSFHPAKTITTGEGGLVTTNQPELYQRLLLYRNNGIVREGSLLKHPEKAHLGYYEVQAVTGGFHLTEMQAALGLNQLSRIESFITKRRKLTELYRKELQNIPYLRLFSEQATSYTAWHLCVVQIDFSQYKTCRENFMDELRKRGIGTQVHYIPLYCHPVYKKGNQGDCPEMDIYNQQALSLPLYYDLKEAEVKRVCQQLKALLTIS